jgi:hypothetical protein
MGVLTMPGTVQASGVAEQVMMWESGSNDLIEGMRALRGHSIQEGGWKRPVHLDEKKEDEGSPIAMIMGLMMASFILLGVGVGLLAYLSKRKEEADLQRAAEAKAGAPSPKASVDDAEVPADEAEAPAEDSPPKD